MDLEVICIGASAGGISALQYLLRNLKTPSEIAIIIVTHLPADNKSLLIEVLQDQCSFTVKEAESGESLKKETVYIAPPDYHLNIEKDYTLSLSSEEKVNFSRPSIDILMESAAHALHSKAIAILLTGANNDGAKGMKEVHIQGGKTIIQDPAEAEFPTMPNSCLELFSPDKIATLKSISNMIESFRGHNYV